MPPGVAPARTNSPTPASAAPASGTTSGNPPAWLTTSPAATRPAPPRIPYRMIVVRRIALNRLPQYRSPAPKTIAITIAVTVISLASKPRMSTWSGNFGFACENWNSDWLNQSPIEALTAIQVGASRRTCADRTSSR